jgi:NTP pyrophosphatase (non-canonical NTP hydrolase)
MALMVEAAEVAEHFQWLSNKASAALYEETLVEVREEIGDVLITLLNLADKLGVDPVQAAKAKIEQNRAKYPASLVRGKAEKYDRYGGR